MEELLRKYDRPGPRYTSYPTVPAWTDAFGPEDYEAKLREAAALGPEVPLSLYAHIPFCAEMCSYCGCNVVISRSREKHEEYVEVLRRELDLVADRLGARNRLTQIHYGGGTPTSLEEDLLLRLWAKIRERFEIDEKAEVAIEIDPVITRREQLALLRGMGFNRLSLGVQDFTPEVQRAVNRLQTVEETEELVRYARMLGYTGINFDLIYGLPFQKLETFEKTMDEVLRLSPDRVAIFSYAHVPEARPNQRRIDPQTLPTGPEKYALFEMARSKLLAAGYVAIGMDHFAKEEDELAIAQKERRLFRNFQGYTVRPAPDTVAVGASSISDLRGAYAQNLRPLPPYYEAIRAGRFATAKGVHLSADDRIRRDAINALMCNFALDLRWLGEKHGVDAAAHLAESLEKLREMEDDGLLRIGSELVELTEVGKNFVRPAAMAFDAWLERLPPTRKGKLPVFSRTI